MTVKTMSTIGHGFVTNLVRVRLSKSLREATARVVRTISLCMVGAGLLTPVGLAQTPAAKANSGVHSENREKAGRAVRPGIHVPPNEQHPAVAWPIWRQSNHEASVSIYDPVH